MFLLIKRISFEICTPIFYISRPFCKEEQDVYTGISLYQNEFKHFQTTGKDFKIRPSAIEEQL